MTREGSLQSFNYRAAEDREGFAASGRRVHHAAAAGEVGVPGLQLKVERRPSAGGSGMVHAPAANQASKRDRAAE